MMTDRLDKWLTIAWLLLGAAVLLKPSGYMGWTDVALWMAAAWLVVLVGLWYLRYTKSRA
ncbi:MAG: hypothetical protein WBC44_01085 [Planctomycetaceae bacterium]